MNKAQAIAAIKYGRSLGLSLEPGCLVRAARPDLGFGRTLWGVRCGFTADGPRTLWTREEIKSHADMYVGEKP